MKKQIKAYFRHKLSTDERWATKALVRIYRENQTQDEQDSDSVKHDNNIGFTGVDGEFLSSLARQFEQRNSLSPKQMGFVLKKMPKYWKQVISMVPEDKLQVIEMRLKEVNTK